jgi:hypothetical protein
LKGVEQDQAKSGFTNLLLSTAAIVSKTTEDVVEKVYYNKRDFLI